MLVSELASAVDTGHEEAPVKRLSDAEVTPEGLKLKGIKNAIKLDDYGLKKLGGYLGVNKAYLLKCPPELQEVNLNHWLQKWPDAEAMFHVVGEQLYGVHNPDKKIFPVIRLVDVLHNVFDPEDEVKTLHHDWDYVHADIVVGKHSIEVPGDDTFPEELGMPKKGDVTHGGIRFFAYPMQERRPFVQTYLHRLFCSNGMGIAEPELQVELKGNTVEEVLASLEGNAQRLMEGLPNRLEQYKATADVKIPGNLQQFVYQIGRERRLGTRVMDTVMTRTAELPDNPSVYDVTQVFTSVANENVQYRSQLRLQRIGGDLTSMTEHMLHRCDQACLVK